MTVTPSSPPTPPRFSDPQMDAVFRRAYGDHWAWAEAELSPPTRLTVMSEDFDNEMDCALSMLSHGQEERDFDFVCAGIYGLLMVVLQSVHSTGVDVSEVIGRGRELFEGLSNRAHQPVPVFEETVAYLEGMAELCGYETEAVRGLRGRLREMVFRHADHGEYHALRGDMVTFLKDGTLTTIKDGGADA